ncbi:uncharacterized protein ASCRUDRAFT_7935 [Ascoidea rubescens DSM 1968]|uniref:Uncharacterized protein n=1 Tax=Ascoidea rubescens DSM 1968 TaxID=1344418 RepID=A0A1D2VHC7_9ASCO|nr:hypothetical protein ASCRUDRAFT_7935 [Ascoidea rubescens DSM 1968]ODV60960.1 hypothetical protein ASCRUDRAFT_7935 [Ascoidea rubescens DSM 1968]
MTAKRSSPISFNDLESKLLNIKKLSTELQSIATSFELSLQNSIPIDNDFDYLTNNQHNQYGHHLNKYNNDTNRKLEYQFDGLNDSIYWDNYSDFYTKLNLAKDDITLLKNLIPQFINSNNNINDNDDIIDLNDNLLNNINQINNAYKLYSSLSCDYII